MSSIRFAVILLVLTGGLAGCQESEAPCDPANICLKVHAGPEAAPPTPGPPVLAGIVWTPPWPPDAVGVKVAPPLVAWSGPVPPAGQLVVVPLRDILPPPPSLRHCERVCPDQTVCDCKPSLLPAFYFGAVLAAADSNGNGTLDQADLDGRRGGREGARGWSWLRVIHSEGPYPADDRFAPEGLQAGTHPYLEDPSDDSLTPGRGRTFDLNVCWVAEAVPGCEHLETPER